MPTALLNGSLASTIILWRVLIQRYTMNSHCTTVSDGVFDLPMASTINAVDNV